MVDVGLHASVRGVLAVERGLLVELELHGHAVLAGEGAGIVEAAVGNRVVEEVVGLLVGDVEPEALPLPGALCLPVGDPVEKVSLAVDVVAERDGEVGAVVRVLGHPVESCQLEVLVVCGAETLDQLVDVPSRGGDLILLVGEVHRAAVELAPILLPADRLGKPQHDAVCESRFAEACDLLTDALVEGREGLPLLEDPAEQPLPFAAPGVELLVAYGVVASRTVLELQEEESVEEPVALSVGEFVDNVGAELLDRPVEAVAASLIDQGHVADVGGAVLLGRGLGAECGSRAQERRISDKLADFHLFVGSFRWFIRCAAGC